MKMLYGIELTALLLISCNSIQVGDKESGVKPKQFKQFSSADSIWIQPIATDMAIDLD